MKESYEALKMEVIAFEGAVFTDDATGRYDTVVTSGDDVTPYDPRPA